MRRWGAFFALAFVQLAVVFGPADSAALPQPEFAATGLTELQPLIDQHTQAVGAEEARVQRVAEEAARQAEAAKQAALAKAARIAELARQRAGRAAVAPRPPRPPAPVGPPPAAGCVGRKMSRTEARNCFFPLIQKYPWPQERAFQILYCESTGNTSAQNGRHWGLMQLDTGPYWDAATNIMVAYRDYYAPRGNFSKWEC